MQNARRKRGHESKSGQQGDLRDENGDDRSHHGQWSDPDKSMDVDLYSRHRIHSLEDPHVRAQVQAPPSMNVPSAESKWVKSLLRFRQRLRLQ
jgi:hypothetical protein